MNISFYSYNQIVQMMFYSKLGHVAGKCIKDYGLSSGLVILTILFCIVCIEDFKDITSFVSFVNNALKTLVSKTINIIIN